MKYKEEILADYIVSCSIDTKPGENVFINHTGYDKEFLRVLVECIKKYNANPVVYSITPDEEIQLIKELNNENVQTLTKLTLDMVSSCQSYVTLLEDSNVEIDSTYQKQYELYITRYKKNIRDYRLKNCKWIGLRLPSERLAKRFNMTLSEFKNFYYDVCGMDYKKLKEDYLWLKDKMSNTKHIEIIRKDTNLSFDKDGIMSQILCGEKNLPDGEIYTSPIKNSANGIITFNTISRQNDFDFNNIKLFFKDGKVEKFESNNNELLDKILVDEGSRYIGEFALGINPLIKNPHGVILYDEKIEGSIHLALGQSYYDTYNGNDSSLHWDIVQIQKPEYGGGKVIFDDEIIMNDGIILKKKMR